MRRAVFLGCVMFFVGLNLALAKEATPVFDDPIYEARFKSLAAELRCVKCQNQSLVDSPAGIADDLRREVHDLMHEGKTDNEIVEYLVARYGDFIRYRPALKSSTALLWFGPAALFAIALTVLLVNVRSKKRQHIDETTPLTAEEQARVNALLDTEETAGEKKA